jgi:prolyl-tRNA synthetase
MPPKIAPIQVVIVPISSRVVKKNALESARDLYTYAKKLEEELASEGIRVRIDAKTQADEIFEESSESPGRKFNKWEVKGVPLRFEIGDTEVDSKIVTVARRDTLTKFNVNRSDIISETKKLLDNIQESLFEKAKKFLRENTRDAASYNEFKKIMETTRGFIRALWCEDAACEKAIKDETKATTRCLPLGAKDEKGACVHCGKPAHHRWIFGQSY